MNDRCILQKQALSLLGHSRRLCSYPSVKYSYVVKAGGWGVLDTDTEIGHIEDHWLDMRMMIIVSCWLCAIASCCWCKTLIPPHTHTLTHTKSLLQIFHINIQSLDSVLQSTTQLFFCSQFACWKKYIFGVLSGTAIFLFLLLFKYWIK